MTACLFLRNCEYLQYRLRFRDCLIVSRRIYTGRPLKPPCPYIYRLLASPQDIRVFVLASGPCDSPIHGYLQHVSLDTKPLYTALSYTWGDLDRTKTILSENKTLPVTENLYEALKELRHELEGKGENISTLFWTDAICIDQRNILEREQKVKLMEYIYKQASMVDIWLGEAAADSDLAMEFIIELLNALIPLQHMNVGSIGLDEYEKYALRHLDEKAWYALSRLLVRPWFSRV